MFKKLRANLPHYFSKHPSRELRDLYISVGMMDFALASIIIFEPIYLYTLGYTIQHIMLFYAAIYGLYILLIPFGGKIAARFGFDHSIFYSNFFIVGYYLCLFVLDILPFLIFIAPVFLAIQKSLYWPAYHADFILFSQDKQRGRELSGVEVLSSIVYIIGPFFAGVVLEIFNFHVLFIIISILLIISAIPLLSIKEIHDRHHFSYFKTFKNLLIKKHLRNFFAHLGFGEELIVLTIWPIFIYIMIKDYLEIGSIIALTTFLTTIVVLYIGRTCDKINKKKLLNIGTFFYSIVWFLRLSAISFWRILGRSAAFVFSIDTASRVSKETLFIPLVSITYDNAKKENPLAYVVFFEQALAIGKFLTGILIYSLIFLMPDRIFTIAFIVGGLVSLLYLFLKQVSKSKIAC